MSQYAIIFQVLGVLLALFFCFLTFMNTKTWRWVHVTFTFLVFGASVAFCVYAAMAMKTRLAWLQYHDKKEADVEKLAGEVELVTRGDIKDVEGKTDSIASVRAALARTILDRGRVWRQLASTPNPDGTIVLSTAPPADPNAAAAAAPKKHNLEPKTIVFAFGEGPHPDGFSVPVFYVGEYRVSAVAETSVTLEPVLQSPEQARAAQTAGAMWTLYEVCPIDGHDWFKDMDAATLQALIPQQGTGLQPPEYQKLLDQYLNDGKDTDETTPPENLWIEVEFLKPYQVTVDAAATNSVDVTPFDASGQAVLDRVRRAKPGENPGVVDFDAGDTAILDKTTADGLIGDGTAKLVRRVYRRKLNDYELRFHAIARRMFEIASHGRSITLDKAAIEASTAKAAEQERGLQEMKTKLDEDLAKVKFERDELAKYSDALAARLAAVQGELSQLYRSNKAISRELAETSARLTEEIDRRTRAATASR
jgi:hypothetical protein